MHTFKDMDSRALMCLIHLMCNGVGITSNPLPIQGLENILSLFILHGFGICMPHMCPMCGFIFFMHATILSRPPVDAHVTHFALVCIWT